MERQDSDTFLISFPEYSLCMVSSLVHSSLLLSLIVGIKDVSFHTEDSEQDASPAYAAVYWSLLSLSLSWAGLSLGLTVSTCSNMTSLGTLHDAGWGGDWLGRKGG